MYLFVYVWGYSCVYNNIYSITIGVFDASFYNILYARVAYVYYYTWIRRASMVKFGSPAQ